MVELVPCVVKTTSIGEVTLRYLSGSTIYLERVEGLGKKRTRREYQIDLTKSTKTLIPAAFPAKPFEFNFKGLDRAKLADYLFGESWGYWGYNNQPGAKETMESIQHYVYGEGVEEIATIFDDAIDAIAAKCEVRWPELTEMESMIVAGFITANGDKKLLVQSFKALGYDDFEIKSGANFLTGGWDFPDLEGYLLSHR